MPIGKPSGRNGTDRYPFRKDVRSFYGTYGVYSIKGWLPLDSENYRAYVWADGLAEQMEMLERILIGNILSLAKGIGVLFETLVRCHILQ